MCVCVCLKLNNILIHRCSQVNRLSDPSRQKPKPMHVLYMALCIMSVCHVCNLQECGPWVCLRVCLCCVSLFVCCFLCLLFISLYLTRVLLYLLSDWACCCSVKNPEQHTHATWWFTLEICRLVACLLLNRGSLLMATQDHSSRGVFLVEMILKEGMIYTILTVVVFLNQCNSEQCHLWKRSFFFITVFGTFPSAYSA